MKPERLKAKIIERYKADPNVGTVQFLLSLADIRGATPQQIAKAVRDILAERNPIRPMRVRQRAVPRQAVPA